MKYVSGQPSQAKPSQSVNWGRRLARMSVVGLCVVFIPGWVGAGKVAEPIGSGVPVRGG